MYTTSVKVRMKRGGYLYLEVEGRCYNDSDGAGQQYEVAEIDGIYWPSKKGDKKLYRVNPELIYDEKQVEEEFWNIATSSND